ncbi:MAG: outer membrane receptor protein involved in Fe transport [Sphingomonas echinoides]|jgi:outer membrane receptor protein involved in Fe transport
MIVRYSRTPLVAAMLVMPVVFSAPSYASGIQYFTIDAQPLSSALTNFSRQAHVQIFFPAASIVNRRAPAVKGHFGNRQVLAKLIAGSGLVVRQDDGKTIVLGMTEAPKPKSEPGAGAAVGNSGESGDIIVTAQHRREREQDVPIALTVIRGDQIESRNINTASDLENSVPSLEVDQQFGSGQPQYRLRGVGGEDYAANNTNTVGIYVDGVAYPYGVMTQGAIYDVERIEVLRGPQGTLYGRNSTGGAINIISARPTRDFHAGVDASFGQYNAFNLNGFVSGPLSSTVAARVAFTTDQGGAWQYNRDTGEALGNKNQESVRVSLQWRPDSVTTVDLVGDYMRNKSDGSGLQLLSDFKDASGRSYPNDFQTGNPRLTGWGLDKPFANLMGVPVTANPFRNNEAYGGHVELNRDFGWATLTGIGAYRHFTRREFNDFDATASNEAGTYFFNGIDVGSQELRLASRQNQPTRWMLGLYHDDESIDGGFLSDFSDYAKIGRILQTTYKQRVHTSAVFANAEQNITRKLVLSGGLRFEHETRALNDFKTITVWPTVIDKAAISRSLEMNEWSGRAALDWSVTRDVHAYASVSRGVKSGGFTTYNNSVPDQLNPYKPEKLIAYEGGLKTDWLNHRLRVNLAGFYYDYRDYQLQGVFYAEDGSRNGRIVNAEKSHLYGAEAEIGFSPVHGLEINQSVAWKRGKFDVYLQPDKSFTDPVTGVVTTTYTNAGGTRIKIPSIDYKAQAHWLLRLRNDWQIDPEFNVNYRGARWSTSDLSTIPAFWLANANFSIMPAHSRVKVTLWVHNLFDAYVQETRNSFISARTVSVDPPRTYGVRAGIKF